MVVGQLQWRTLEASVSNWASTPASRVMLRSCRRRSCRLLNSLPSRHERCGDNPEQCAHDDGKGHPPDQLGDESKQDVTFYPGRAGVDRAVVTLPVRPRCEGHDHRHRNACRVGVRHAGIATAAPTTASAHMTTTPVILLMMPALNR